MRSTFVLIIMILCTSFWMGPASAYSTFTAHSSVWQNHPSLLEKSFAEANKNPDLALAAIDSVLVLAEQQMRFNTLIRAWDWKHHFYKYRGELELAFQAQDSLIKWRNRVHNSQLQQLQVVPVDLLNQQAETAELRKSLLLQDTQVKRRQLMVYTLIIAMILLLVLLFLLIYRNRTTRRTYSILEKRNQSFQERNHELQVQKEKLEASEKMLVEVNQSKDRFFSLVAQDLRTPLTTLSAYLSTLLKNTNDLSADQQNELAIRIDGTVRHLWHLIENLLHWSRSQMRSLDTAPANFSIERVIREQVSNLESVAIEKEIQFVVNIPEELSAQNIFADRSQTEFVLRNLLSNAIKHSPGAGRVSIYLQSPNEEELQITVEDQGEGLSQEQINSLWGDGPSLAHVPGDESAGSGLGLRLTKTYIEMNHGDLTVESEPGKSTKFSFTLPKEQAHD